MCIVSDGRTKINERTLKVIGLYGAYQDGIAKDTVDGKDVQAHLFEYTTQVVVDSKGTVSGGIAPVQVRGFLSLAWFSLTTSLRRSFSASRSRVSLYWLAANRSRR